MPGTKVHIVLVACKDCIQWQKDIFCLVFNSAMQIISKNHVKNVCGFQTGAFRLRISVQTWVLYWWSPWCPEPKGADCNSLSRAAVQNLKSWGRPSWNHSMLRHSLRARYLRNNINKDTVWSRDLWVPRAVYILCEHWNHTVSYV